MQVFKINDHVIFDKKFTFCTLVTRYEEYLEMVDSAKNKGFIGEDVEYLYFDNKESNKYDGYSGINRAIKEAKGEYLIFCHQDILFEYDGYEQLKLCLNELEEFDSEWAIAGNAGKNDLGKAFIRLTDPVYENLNYGPFPQKVISVDENFMVLNLKKSFCSSSNLRGFHFYGLDLARNAEDLGLNTYVIDFHLRHKSLGNVDKSFYDQQQLYIKMIKSRMNARYVRAMCTQFYLSHSKIMTFLLRYKFFVKLRTSYTKRKLQWQSRKKI